MQQKVYLFWKVDVSKLPKTNLLFLVSSQRFKRNLFVFNVPRKAIMKHLFNSKTVTTKRYFFWEFFLTEGRQCNKKFTSVVSNEAMLPKKILLFLVQVQESRDLSLFSIFNESINEASGRFKCWLKKKVFLRVFANLKTPMQQKDYLCCK